MLLERHAVADERDRRPGRLLAIEQRPRSRPSRSSRRPRRRSPSTSTSVPVRSRRNPSAYPTGRIPIQVSRGGDEAPAVAGRLARPQQLRLRDLACATRAPARDRPPPDPRRTARARRARSRTARRRTATPGSGAQRRCSRRAASAREAAAVASRKRAICARANAGSLSAVARCVISPTTSRAGARQLREPPAPHARVELQVDRDPFRQLAARERQLEPRLACGGDLGGRDGPEDEDARVAAASRRSASASATVATQSAVAPASSAAAAQSAAPWP